MDSLDVKSGGTLEGDAPPAPGGAPPVAVAVAGVAAATAMLPPGTPAAGEAGWAPAAIGAASAGVLRGTNSGAATPSCDAPWPVAGGPGETALGVNVFNTPLGRNSGAVGDTCAAELGTKTGADTAKLVAIVDVGACADTAIPGGFATMVRGAS